MPEGTLNKKLGCSDSKQKIRLLEDGLYSLYLTNSPEIAGNDERTNYIK